MCYTEKRCGIFYTAPHKSPMISKLCNGDVCTCAEGGKNFSVLWNIFIYICKSLRFIYYILHLFSGGCPRNKVTFSKDIKDKTRSRYACYSPGVDYGEKLKANNVQIGLPKLIYILNVFFFLQHMWSKFSTQALIMFLCTTPH